MVIYTTSHAAIPAHLLEPTIAYLLANPSTPEHQKLAVRKDQPTHQEGYEARPLSALLPVQKQRTMEADFDVVDEPDRYLLYTDLPGVKLEDVTVQLKTNGCLLQIQGIRRNRGKQQEPKKYLRKLAVDDAVVDTSQPWKAILSDGTLEICAMKHQEPMAKGPRRIPVMIGHPPEEFLIDPSQTNNKNLLLEVDIPGVKADALEVVYLDGNLILLGHRKRGEQVQKVQRSFALDARRIESNQLTAYLCDGVLTICAPAKKLVGDRWIPVVGAGSEVPTTAATELEKPKPKKPRLIPVVQEGTAGTVKNQTPEPNKEEGKDTKPKQQHNRSNSDGKLGWHKGFLLPLGNHDGTKRDSDTDSTSSSQSNKSSDSRKKKRSSPPVAIHSSSSSVDSEGAEKRECKEVGKDANTVVNMEDSRCSPPAPFKIVPETVNESDDD